MMEDRILRDWQVSCCLIEVLLILQPMKHLATSFSRESYELF